MTVGARIKTAFVSGTITNNPLAVGDVTLNAAALSSLAAITAPDYAAIVLDPAGSAGAPEVVWVTAHTAAATSATISRGQEGSAARQHLVGVPWVHGPTIMDLTQQQGTDLASASTLTLPNSSEDYYNVTGTTTVTAISARGAGKVVTLRFTGACPITHNGTSLILLNAASITTVAGDVIQFVSEGGGNWRQISYKQLVASRYSQISDANGVTMTTAPTTYYLATTISLAAGTWLLNATVTFTSTGANIVFSGGIFDNAGSGVRTVFTGIATSGYSSSISVSLVVVLTSTSVYKLGGISSTNGQTLAGGHMTAVRLD